MLRLGEFDQASVSRLLARFTLELRLCPAGESIPYSYWGDDEAGLRGAVLYAREDTPLHSILHETSHFICADPARRAVLQRDAGSDDAEESAVCYLQILLAGELPGLGRERMFADMDRWGYSFRMGSTRAWFDFDARDALAWLLAHDLVSGERVNFRLRQAQVSL